MKKTIQRGIPAFVEKVIASKVWESISADERIYSTGGAMSCMALNAAFVQVEVAIQLNGKVDYVVVGCERFGDIRTWGLLQGDKLWDAHVVRDMRIPPGLALVCSTTNKGVFSLVEVVLGL
jgi:hypothetical protein